MKARSGYLFVLLLLLFGRQAIAQNESTKWYFSLDAALDFMTSPPTTMTNNAMSTIKGSSSIADAAGNLLFYTDGLTIWNSNHTVMANGTGIAAHGTWTYDQSNLVIKKPGSTTLYYLFTVNSGNLNQGFCYSIIDMSLAAGLGSVTVKNHTVLSTACSPKITGTRHCNGTDFWVTVHERASSNFRTYLLTATGLNTVAVVSPVGSSNSPSGQSGNLKLSPNGKKLVQTFGFGNNVELYDFNNSTGVISNSLVLTTSAHFRGCEFSPDATKLYAARSSQDEDIIQWDLCAGSGSAIISSAYTVSTAYPPSMQLAPNGKIYMAHSSYSLQVINNPNSLGAACNFVAGGPSVAPKGTFYSLPNFMGYPFLQAPHAAPFTYTANNTVGCQTASFAATSAAGCQSAGYTVTGISWDFGDPGSGAANTSTLYNPSHIYPTLGNYSVTLVYYYTYGCGTLNDTLRQLVNISQSCLTVNSQSISCATLGSATVNVINAAGPYSYTWMPSSQNSSVATGLSPGTYSITVYAAGNNLTFSTTETFTTPVPYTGTLTNNLFTCPGLNTGTAGITIGGGSSATNYSWIPQGSGTTQTTAIASGLGIGVYSVVATDQLTGCSLTRTFQVIQSPSLAVNIAASASACVGSAVTMTANVAGGIPAYTYSWSGGSFLQTQSATVSAGGIYGYSVVVSDANTCSGAATATISFVNNPVLSIQHVSICPGETGILSANGAASYTWSQGNNVGNTFTASPLVSTHYSVAGAAASCTSVASASIIVKPVPALFFNTFSITCASLGSATVTPAGGTGPYTYTWLPVAQTGFSLGGLSPNTYTVSAFDAGTGCTTSSVTVFTSLIPLTGDLLTSGAVACYSGSTGIASFTNLSGGSGSENYIWTNGSTTFTTANVNTLYAGTWSVTVTDALTACQVYSVFSVTQPPAMTLNIGANTSTVCLGGNIVLTATNSGGTPGYSFLWANGPPASTFSVSENTAGTYTYSLTSFDSNTCAITETVTVEFVPNPAISAANVSICPLETGTLTATGANNYTWSTGSNNAVATDNPLSTTVYTVTGEALSCMSTTTASIVLKTPPLVLISSNSPRCEGSALQMITNGGAGFLWDGPQGFTSTIVNPAIDTLLTGHAGIYNVTVTAANNCTAAASHTVIVNPTPTLSVLGATVCSIRNASLTANSVPGASYKWNGPLNFSSVQQNPVLVTPVVAASGNYTVTATSPQNCTNTAAVSVSVVPPPSLTAKLSSHSLCSQAFNGSPNTITLTAGGADTYSLITVPDLFNANPSGPVSPLSSIPPYSGIASATLFGSNGICTVTAGLTFSIIPNPTVSVNNYTPEICAGQSFTYTNAGANSYTWSNSAPNFTTYNNGGVAVANPSINSVFSVYGGSLGCNSASRTSTITVHPIPSVSVTAAANFICPGSSTVLTAGGTATHFSWTPGTGLNNNTGKQVNAAPFVNQIYTVTGSANNCTNSAVAGITVLTLPQPAAAVSKPAVCNQESVTLTGSGGEIYRWFGPNSLSFGGSSVSFKASLHHTGTYTLTVTDKNGCSNSAIIALEVLQLPQGSLTGDKMQACVPFCSDLAYHNSTSSASVITADWSLDNRTYSGKSFQHCFTRVGEHIVTGKFKDTQTGCNNTQTFAIIGFPVPAADFTWQPEHPVEGLEDVLFFNTSVGERQEKFSWHFISNSDHRSQHENTSYFFRNAGSYPVAFVVQNSYGCSDTILKKINVEVDFTFFMPNTFTPNGDDRNDVFIPVTRGIKRYDLKIFNRWGDLIFHSTDVTQGWNGTFHSGECRQDVYAWKATVFTIQGEAKQYSGHVTLLR